MNRYVSICLREPFKLLKWKGLDKYRWTLFKNNYILLSSYDDRSNNLTSAFISLQYYLMLDRCDTFCFYENPLWYKWKIIVQENQNCENYMPIFFWMRQFAFSQLGNWLLEWSNVYQEEWKWTFFPKRVTFLQDCELHLGSSMLLKRDFLLWFSSNILRPSQN